MKELDLPAPVRKKVMAPGDDFDPLFDVDINTSCDTLKSEAAIGVIPSPGELSLIKMHIDAAVEAHLPKIKARTESAVERLDAKLGALAIFWEERPSSVPRFNFTDAPAQPPVANENGVDSSEPDNRVIEYTSLENEGLPRNQRGTRA